MTFLQHQKWVFQEFIIYLQRRRYIYHSMAAEEYRELKNRIAYILMVIRDFGEEYNLSPKQAHSYLSRYKAMDFMDKCYEAEHTLSLKDAVDDMTAVSKRNGGQLG
ncbi:MAG: DUF3791 domain-containing protein [Bacteroidaceae bacterium]|nr:DUF3791 domain-containing protein [Bacteroidaceae bacterium]MBQ9884297.1 DUF3791 domain-containing protein [Bacteroidaceae bacterium]